MMKRLISLLILATVAVCIGVRAGASAEDRCVVADPSGTPLNVRTAPDGRTIGTLNNGIQVMIFDRSSVEGRPWVYVGRYEDRVPIGWVYRNYLNCGATATSQTSPYIVDGLALGGQVRFESDAYRQYRCNRSEKFSGFTWCHKEKKERTKRGEVTSSNSILHSQDGTAVYVNHYSEPAFFGPKQVRSEIERLSAKFGEDPHLIRMPPRDGLPNAVIAVWGAIKLEPLGAAEVWRVASGQSHEGLLVSFLGDLQRSARAGVPVYRLAGGAGFLWAATFNQNGRGVLRFLAFDATKLASPTIAQNPPAPQPEPASTPPVYEGETAYAKVGWWSVIHKQERDFSGCSARTPFAGQTLVELALIQSDSGKMWAFFMSNPRWGAWIAGRSEHELWLLTTERWHVTFKVSDDKKTLMLDASVDFMNSLADARLLQIFSDNKEPLVSIDLKDSESAIKAVSNCVTEHPLNRTPTPEPADRTFSSGTAFFVAPSLLLTNNHVVRECKAPIQVRYPDRPWYSATLSGLDETNDLALLHTEMGNVSVASFRSRLRLGDSVASYGFPYPGVLSSSGNFTVGNVTSLSGISDDTRFLQTSTPTQPGNSGGPLLDMSGNVVGVVDAQLNALAMMQANNSLPQNVNFAIQVPIVINFLSVKGVSPPLETSNAPGTLTTSDVAGLAKQFTVQVYCEAISPKTSAR
jgi:S1-C subfamily serine protease